MITRSVEASNQVSMATKKKPEKTAGNCDEKLNIMVPMTNKEAVILSRNVVLIRARRLSQAVTGRTIVSQKAFPSRVIAVADKLLSKAGVEAKPTQKRVKRRG